MVSRNLKYTHMHTKQIILPPDAHILVVKLATIGDLLLATPSLHALRETYPQARIDLLVTPASAGLLDDWAVIDRVIVLDKYLFDYPQQLLKNPRSLLRLRPLWHNLHDGDYDAVLLLHHLTLFFGRLKHQLLMRATGAKWRIGLDNGHGWFLNVRVKDAGFGAMHEADYNLAVAKAAGASTNNKRLTVPINEVERQQARHLLYETDLVGASLVNTPQLPEQILDHQNVVAGPSPAGSHPPAKLEEHPHIKRPVIAMHPGSGGYSTARRWAPERFAQLADTLFYDTGGQLILVGGPEEAELHKQIIGLMHLATAVGTPTVAIFGLTNSDAWGPYTGGLPAQQAVVVKMDLPCMPCFYRGHDLGTPEGCMTRDCLALLGIDPIATAARRLLRQPVKQPHLVGETTKRN